MWVELQRWGRVRINQVCGESRFHERTRKKEFPQRSFVQDDEIMPKASLLAAVRSGGMSILGCVVLFLGMQVQAQDSFDSVDLPAPSDGSGSPYDIPSPSERNAAIRKSELDVAKQHLKSVPLNRVNATIKPPEGDMPNQVYLDGATGSPIPSDESAGQTRIFMTDQSRPWLSSCFWWEAPASRHLPLLFEEPNLERLGYAYGCCDIGMCDEEPRLGQRVQALVSGVNFYGRIPFAPFMCCYQPFTEPVYTLGTDRPGSPVPYRKYLPHMLPLTGGY